MKKCSTILLEKQQIDQHYHQVKQVNTNNYNHGHNILRLFDTIFSTKIAVMHGKVKFSKNKRTKCNVPMKSSEVCDILPRSADSNGEILDIEVKQ